MTLVKCCRLRQSLSALTILHHRTDSTLAFLLELQLQTSFGHTSGSALAAAGVLLPPASTSYPPEQSSGSAHRCCNLLTESYTNAIESLWRVFALTFAPRRSLAQSAVEAAGPGVVTAARVCLKTPMPLLTVSFVLSKTVKFLNNSNLGHIDRDHPIPVANVRDRS